MAIKILHKTYKCPSCGNIEREQELIIEGEQRERIHLCWFCQLAGKANVMRQISVNDLTSKTEYDTM